MINNDKISVLITSHKARFNTLNRVIGSWLTQPVDEIWVIDDGNNFKTEIKDPRLLIFNMPKDFETKSDYALALLTEGDIIILADDDIVVRDTFTNSFYNSLKKTNNSIVGLAGKKCFGPRYNKDTQIYKSNMISQPIEVEYVGIVIMASRDRFGFDLKGMNKNCDDFWFCMKIHPNINKYIVPTIDYTDLPCSENKTAMHKSAILRKPRYDFYTYYWNNLIKFKNNQIKNIRKNKKITKKISQIINNEWKNLHNNNIK